jgi:hypothetical protein
MGAEVLNEVTGEAVLTDKTGREYRLVFDFTAVRVLEKLAERGVMAILHDPSANDCVAMIMAGTAGWARRNHGSAKVNGNLAERIFIDSGGYRKVAPVLIQSLSCAEGLNLDDDGDANEDDEAAPLALPS